MGNNESSQRSSTHQIYEQFTLVSVEDHPALGDVSVYKDKSTGDSVWIKEVTIEDRNSEVKLDAYLKNDSWRDQAFITRQLYKVIPPDSFLCTANCSSVSKVIVVMNMADRDLQSEIVQRSSEYEKDYFSEAEIWYIIESIMAIEARVLKSNQFHGDLRTSTIFLTEDGHAKFIDPVLLDHHSSAYLRTMTGQTRSNLSPEYAQAMRACQRELKLDPEPTEVFAIGIIILALSTLHEDSWYYNWSLKDLSWQNVRQSLEELHVRYSPLLHQLAMGCLKERMAERLRFVDILRYIDTRKNTFS